MQHLAGPLDPLVKWVEPWTIGLVVLGALFLGGCLTWATMKLAARTAAAKAGDTGSTRQGIAAIVVILFCGVVLGGGSIALALAVELGKSAPAVTATGGEAPPPDAAE